jgi:hypothetical protein
MFNLLMLFVVGPFVEDVWGRPIFAAFYLAARAFAGIMFAIVARENAKSVALMDLLLDLPGVKRDRVRTYRVFADTFDPRAFFASDDLLSAFRLMVAHVLDVSLATPLPDRESVRGEPFKSFKSLVDYERRVLSVTE